LSRVDELQDGFDVVSLRFPDHDDGVWARVFIQHLLEVGRRDAEQQFVRLEKPKSFETGNLRWVSIFASNRHVCVLRNVI
jgi:hypothetical protein